MAFTAKDVQNLRERTGAGMMDCKKALTASDGDFDKAVEDVYKRQPRLYALLGLGAPALPEGAGLQSWLVAGCICPGKESMVVRPPDQREYDGPGTGPSSGRNKRIWKY